VTRFSFRTLPCASTLIAVSVVLSIAQEGARVSHPDARSLIDDGNYEEAEALARLELEAVTSLGADSMGVARASDALVRLLVLNGRTADGETLALAQRALKIKEDHLGSLDAELVPSLLNLGDVRIAAAEFEQAIAVTRRAVVLCERTAGPDGLEVAEALDHLGDALSETGRYDEAVKTLERSLQLREKAAAGSAVPLARTLERLALVLQRRGDYAPAGRAIRRAAAIQLAVNANHPAYAGTLNLVAQQFWFEGQLLDSKAASEQAVLVAERTLRPDHPIVALSLRYLANTLSDLGDSVRSLELTRRALAIAERTFGPNHHMTAKYLHSLGLAELDQGEYLAAREHFQQALGVYQARYGQWHELVATAHNVLALADARLGDYAGSSREQSRAIAIFSRIGGPAHPYVAISLTELATVYLEQGQPAQALPLLERALAIREKALGPRHGDVARTLVDLASTLMQAGQPSRAQRLAERAVAIWDELNAPDAPDYATVLALYAELQRRRGDDAAAREYFERALAIRSRVFGPSNPVSAETQSGLALALASLGHRAESLDMARSAETIGRDHLRLLLRTLPERQALNYAATRPRGLDLILSLSTTVPEAVAMAMDGTIRSRALVLDEIAARSVASSGSVDGADSVHARLMSAQQRLANLTVRGPGQMSDAQFKSLVDATRQEAETAEQELAAQSAEFRAERSRAETGLDDVVRALPLNSALVSIVHYNRTSFRAREAGLPASAPRRAAPPVPSYLAIVVRPGQAPAAVAIGSIARIDALIEQWRADIASEVLSTAAAVEGRASDDSRASGVALRQAVWDPLARYLGNANLVFVVPDGAFSMVPLAALPVGARSYLLEAGPVIHYLSAERDLLQRDELRADRGLLAIGGASFDGRIPPPAETAMTLRGGTAGCTDFRSISFPQLAGTAREVKDISSVWNAQTGAESGMARLLLGREAGETTFKREAHGYRVVHLATHGFFLDNSCAPAPSGTRGVGGLARTGSRAVENPLLLSGLALAGANRRARARADDESRCSTCMAPNGPCSPPATPASAKSRPAKASSASAARSRWPARAP
jgi:tetratricopeptide (TPR) repeat protein